MKWQMVGFVREGTWLLPFSYSQVKTRDRITITG